MTTKIIAIALTLIALLVVSGCTTATGCVPLKIDGKQVNSSPNVQRLVLEINGEHYNYYNPSLTTYHDIEVNNTYLMRFQPMLSDMPYVELCGGSV